jgi:OOP family OmpA-OmpF porin
MQERAACVNRLPQIREPGGHDDIVQPVRRKVQSACFALAVSLGAAPGQAWEDCPRGRYTSCLDVNALWLRPGNSEFLSVASPAPAGRATVTVRAGASLLEHPLSLEVEGPEAGGRELALVERAIDQHLLLAFRVSPRLELGLATSTVLRQSGDGPGAIRSQSASSLPATAVRDPRLGLGFTLIDAPGAALSVRADVALPFGDRDAYASAGALTAAPSAAGCVEFGRVAFGAELGARLRPSVELGNVRQGSQLYAALGLSIALIPEFRLAAELFALPGLVDSTSARARELGLGVRSLPAEWLASARWSPLPAFSATLAGGSGLPLSTERGNATSERFLAPTSPAFRALIDLGYSY